MCSQDDDDVHDELDRLDLVRRLAERSGSNSSISSNEDELESIVTRPSIRRRLLMPGDALSKAIDLAQQF